MNLCVFDLYVDENAPLNSWEWLLLSVDRGNAFKAICFRMVVQEIMYACYYNLISSYKPCQEEHLT